MGKMPVRGLVGLCWFGVALAASGGCSWMGGGSSSYQGNQGKLLSQNPPARPAVQQTSSVVQASGTTGSPTNSTSAMPSSGPASSSQTPMGQMSSASPVNSSGLPQTRTTAGDQAWGKDVPMPGNAPSAMGAGTPLPAPAPTGLTTTGYETTVGGPHMTDTTLPPPPAMPGQPPVAPSGPAVPPTAMAPSMPVVPPPVSGPGLGGSMAPPASPVMVPDATGLQSPPPFPK